jgi:hypothetical protein
MRVRKQTMRFKEEKLSQRRIITAIPWTAFFISFKKKINMGGCLSATEPS